VLDTLQIPVCLAAGLDSGHSQAQVADDAGQQVVELVGDTPSKGVVSTLNCRMASSLNVLILCKIAGLRLVMFPWRSQVAMPMGTWATRVR
jgi:hypothetical protein